VRFGGKVDDGVRPMLRQKPGHQFTIADVAVHEHVPRVVMQRRQRVRVAGIGQFVQIDHVQAIGDRLQHEIGADEASSAGHQQCLDLCGGVVHSVRPCSGDESRALKNRSPADCQ
jgi:hypothetical protein